MHQIAPNGFFLDHIIRPVYTVAKESTETIANCHKYNYDDLNEFFWSKNCLRFHHVDATGQKLLNGSKDGDLKLKFRSPSSVDDMEASLVPVAAGGALNNDLNAPLIPSVRLTQDPTDQFQPQSSNQLERVLDKSALAADVVAPVCLELAKLRKTYPERSVTITVTVKAMVIRTPAIRTTPPTPRLCHLHLPLFHFAGARGCTSSVAATASSTSTCSLCT